MTVSAYVIQYRIKARSDGGRWTAWRKHAHSGMPQFAEYLRGKCQEQASAYYTDSAVETRIIRQKVYFRA